MTLVAALPKPQEIPVLKHTELARSGAVLHVQQAQCIREVRERDGRPLRRLAVPRHTPASQTLDCSTAEHPAD